MLNKWFVDILVSALVYSIAVQCFERAIHIIQCRKFIKSVDSFLSL